MAKLWIGTFTNNKSQGVYSLDFIDEKQLAKKPTLEHKTSHPNYLKIKKDQLILCCSAEAGHKGGMAAMALKNNQLLANSYQEVLPEKTEPCYITANNEGTLFLTANYFSEQLCTYELSENKLNLKQVIKLEGSSSHPDQTQARPHFIEFISESELLICDLGSDLLYLMTLTKENSLKILSSFKLPAGTGPRHVQYHEDTQMVYVIGELNNSLSILKKEKETLRLLDTFPIDSVEFNGDSAGAIRLSPQKNFLYTTNRTKNTISVFKLEDHGTHLTKIQTIGVFGQHPRDMIFNSQGDLLIVANQFSHNLTTFQVNPTTGELHLAEIINDIPEPCCLVLH